MDLTLEDAPIISYVNKILLDAIQLTASDIHFELYEQKYRIRYRQDGILYEVATPPIHWSARITARIKIMSNLDIAERRVPQDGGFKMQITEDRCVDFRVSTCPTSSGCEKVVVRVQDAAAMQLDIDKLGLNKPQKDVFLRAISKPQGMILVTGPTGSGKTITLYAALNRLNTPEVNIATVEDPVEIKVIGINQVPINLKAGLTFPKTLRAFLRQDPDIIMVGEIRDAETAEIAIKAAQTGHLVLSTVHTNNTIESIDRLLHLGVSALNIANSVSLIIAQRLARKLCQFCKQIRVDGYEGFRPNGCGQCINGYKGRIGLFELLPITKSIVQLILSCSNQQQILEQARLEGMCTLLESGMEQVKLGTTSIEEINRVTVEY